MFRLMKKREEEQGEEQPTVNLAPLPAKHIVHHRIPNGVDPSIEWTFPSGTSNTDMHARRKS